jgi:hypothetical protein
MNPERNNGFHRDADGNAMIFVVIVLFTLVCFFVFTIHIGQRFTNKVEMQNAADAAAISGAVWKARGFNLISIMNVSMSECLALIIMFKAFDSTLKFTKVAHKINKSVATACCSIPYSAAVCCPWKAVLTGYEPILSGYDRVNDVMKKTWKSPKILWKVMSALKKVSQVVSYATSVIAYYDASRIAERNGADALVNVGGFGYHAVLWPYQYELPVKDGSFEQDLCDHTWNGGDGYKNYLCYDDAFDIEIAGIGIDTTIEGMWAILSLIMPPPILTYEAMKHVHYNDLCSTSGSSSDMDLTLQESTMRCDKCLEEEGEATWEGYRVELTRYECDDRWTKESTEATQLDTVTHSNGQRPQGTVLFNGRDHDSGNSSIDTSNPPGPCRVCNNLHLVAPEQEGQPPRYFADIWALKSCLYESEEQEIEIESENHDEDKVPPLVLDDDWRDKVKYTSLVFKRENNAGSSFFLGSDGEPILSLRSDMSGEMMTYGEEGDSRLKSDTVNIPERTWSVARAEVYNPGQEDLFNQNWHAKLAPVDAEGIQTEFMGMEIELPESLTGLTNDVVEEVWAH